MSGKGKGKSYRIGCQSWQYEDWITLAGGETIFYPRATRPPDMLRLYSQIFDTIEVDSTAYGTPAASTILGWVEETPDDFQFSLKVPRAVTHEFSLSPSSYPLFDEFVDAARIFRRKLGVILVQLPAAFEATKENGQYVRNFLSRLPGDLRFGIEFRHPGWFVDWMFEEVDSHGVALALVAGKWVPEETMFDGFAKTDAPFAYIRVMGIRDIEKFDRVYRDRSQEIARWVRKIKRLRAKDVFIYVDNHFEGHAPATAMKVKEFLHLPVVDPASLEAQASLF